MGQTDLGKTTLLRSLATLLPPTLGTMRIFGKDPNQEKDSFAQKIGWLSHRTGLYEDLSAVENLIVFGSLFGRKFSKEQAEQRIEEVGLEITDKPVKVTSQLEWKTTSCRCAVAIKRTRASTFR